MASQNLPSFWPRLLISSAAISYGIARWMPQLAWKGSLVWTAAMVAALQVVVQATYQLVIYPYYLSPFRDIPGPKVGLDSRRESNFQDGNLFLGQIPTLLAESSGAPFIRWSRIPNNGLLRYMILFGQEHLAVTSAEAIKEVLVTRAYDFVKPPDVAKELKFVVGDGLLTSEGDVHKGLMPAFAFRHVKEQYPKFWAKAVEMVEAVVDTMSSEKSKAAPPADKVAQTGPAAQQLQSELLSDAWTAESHYVKSEAAEVEITNFISRTTLDIIGIVGMGYDFGSLKDPNNRLAQEYHKIFNPGDIGVLFIVLFITLPIWLFKALPLRRNLDILSAVKYIRQTSLEILRAKKNDTENGEVDILSAARESNMFTEENLVDQLMTFLAAGHETTATAMTWAVHHLSIHPELQAQLRKEVRENLPSPENSNDVPSSQDIDRLPLLNAFCNEVLRYYTPVPATSRVASHDTTIIGRKIPAGTRVAIAPIATNIDESLWGDDATVFSMDRWLAPGQANAGGAKNNYANLTFLHGPRSCIGRDFARAEFAILVAVFVGRLEVLAPEPDKIYKTRGATAKPIGGIRVACRLVEGW